MGRSFGQEPVRPCASWTVQRRSAPTHSPPRIGAANIGVHDIHGQYLKARERPLSSRARRAGKIAISRPGIRDCGLASACPSPARRPTSDISCSLISVVRRGSVSAAARAATSVSPRHPAVARIEAAWELVSCTAAIPGRAHRCGARGRAAVDRHSGCCGSARGGAHAIGRCGERRRMRA